MSIGNVNNYTYDYDTYGRLNKIATPAGDFTYTRPADSDLVTAMARPNNVTSNWTFEEHRNLLASVTNGSVSTYTYTNDALGRRTNVTRSGSAFSDTNILTYGYNSRSEVISALSNINANYSFSYNYDPIGNRLNSTLAGTAWSYTSNNLNQYTALTSGNTTQSPAYDADGNMTFRDGWTQIWNGENRLVEMYNDTTKLTFSYDYMGRRIEKKVFQQTGGIWAPQKSLQYVYDGYKLIEEIDTLPDEKPVIRRYTWQPESQGADLPLVVTDVASDQSYFYTADGNKNISELVDATGNIAAHYEYDPFGKINTQNGAYAASNPFRFSSEYFDSETGLVYYNYRYYSPELGRWINRDPIQEKGGWNLYAMVENRVSNTNDTLGTYKYQVNKDKTDTVNVEECEIVIFDGHGDDERLHKFIFPENSECITSAAGFTGCYSMQNNQNIPPEYRIPGLPLDPGEIQTLSPEKKDQRRNLVTGVLAKAREFCGKCCKSVKISNYSNMGRGWGWFSEGDRKANYVYDCKSNNTNKINGSNIYDKLLGVKQL